MYDVSVGVLPYTNGPMLTMPGSAEAIGSTPASWSASTCEYRSSMDASSEPPRTVGCSRARGCTASTSVHASWYGAGSWRAGPPTLGSSLWLCTIAAPRSRHSSAHSAISAGDRGTAGLTDLVVLPLIAASMITGPRFVAIEGERMAPRPSVACRERSAPGLRRRRVASDDANH